MKNIPIVIPSYEPDWNLETFIKSFDIDNEFFIVIDDGSGEKYQEIFNDVEKLIGSNGVVLHHEVNKGKGAALKTAFNYILAKMPDIPGVVTADSDGQHVRASVEDVTKSLIENPKSLVLGVRSFDRATIPWKSWFGNTLTIKVMKYLSGVSVSDTQTGLRGIPTSFFKILIDECKSDRFEFETQMLLATKGRFPIVEVPIATIYDSKEDHATHFDPFRDSIRIYKVIGKQFIKFIGASFSSSILDLLLFTIFCALFTTLGLENSIGVYLVTLATVAARILSAVYNYIINYKVVFKSNENHGKSVSKYILLAVVQMALSAICTTLLVYLLPAFNKTVLKAVVDIILFFISYNIQNKFIFKKNAE